MASCPTDSLPIQRMMRAALIATCAVAGTACSAGDGLDTKLSTELVNARFSVLEWPPPPGATRPPETQPAHTKCGLRLRDENTGTVYTLSQSAKVLGVVTAKRASP